MRGSRLVRESPSRLSLKPSAGARVFFAGLVLLGLGAMALSAVFFVQGRRDPHLVEAIGKMLLGGSVAVSASVMILIGLLGQIFARSFRFDRKRGECAVGSPFRVWRRPLADILLVRLWAHRMNVFVGGARRRNFNGTIQIVFRGEPETVLTIAANDDEAWTVETAQRLAEYLDVPLEEIGDTMTEAPPEE